LIYRGKIRIGTGITIIEGQKEASLRAKDVKTPIYILHGKDDKITDYRGSEKFYKEVPINDKTVFIADGKKCLTNRLGS
jgi:alpha-beta hydrolase superfamily lysophospholipase